MAANGILSEGVHLHADVYTPNPASHPLPTIILSHGWGGTAAMLRPQATDFAQAGYFVIAFDYRGWGESHSRVIQTAPAATGKVVDGHFTGEMQELRGMVDPLDQAMDIQNIAHYGIYDEAREQSTRLAIDWFDQHLKK